MERATTFDADPRDRSTREQPVATEATTPQVATGGADTTADAWEDLSIPVPNDRDPVGITAFVETVLVELTHEPVGAVHSRGEIGRDERREIVCLDDVGQQFELRRYVARHGWTSETVSRETLRETLVTLLSRGDVGSGDNPRPPGSFSVQPAVRLQSRCLDVGDGQ